MSIDEKEFSTPASIVCSFATLFQNVYVESKPTVNRNDRIYVLLLYCFSCSRFWGGGTEALEATKDLSTSDVDDISNS